MDLCETNDNLQERRDLLGGEGEYPLGIALIFQINRKYKGPRHQNKRYNGNASIAVDHMMVLVPRNDPTNNNQSAGHQDTVDVDGGVSTVLRANSVYIRKI